MPIQRSSYSCKSLRNYKLNNSLIKNSRKINETGHKYLYSKLIKMLKILDKKSNIKIFLIGIAFKGYPETSDIRNQLQYGSYLSLNQKKIFMHLTIM